MHIDYYDGLIGISDASWGSSDVEKRRSVSGGLIIWRGCVVKSFSRLQGCVTLSSCEAEVVAVCQVAQECIGLRHLVEYLDSFTDTTELHKFQQEGLAAMQFDQIGSSGVREYFPVLLYSDSQSCIAVLQNQGLSRRVRHISLATCYVQSLVENGHMVLVWILGKFCSADLLTKILNRELTEFHREQIGICEITAPETWQTTCGKELKKRSKQTKDEKVPEEDVAAVQHDLENKKVMLPEEPLSTFPYAEIASVGSGETEFELKLLKIMSDIADGKVSHVIVELCTSNEGGFSQVIRRDSYGSLRIVPVTEDDNLNVVHLKLCDWIDKVLRDSPKVMLMCWASPPCTGGSPVINLIPEPRRAEIREQRVAEFALLIESSRGIMMRCHVRCLELAKPSMYWKDSLVQTYCHEGDLKHVTIIQRCAYIQSEEAQAKHEFKVASNCMLFDPKSCQCNTHLHALGVYPLKLVQKLASWQSLPE